MDPRIVFVSSTISCDLRKELDLAGLARSVNLSRSRLRHLFRAEQGMTLSQFQRAMRLDLGRTLLATTFLSVKEIMNTVGFSDPSFFVHEFKKTNGMSPTAYRNQLFASVLQPH
jgi:AraC family transcriptional regulator, arabinose operon regulatory protein